MVIAILCALEINVEETDNSDVLRLKVPTYRVDVYRPCDVVEEILRVYGYNNVEIYTEAHINLSQRTDVDFSNDLQQLVAEQLTGQGFSEIMNNSLSSQAYYAESEQLPLANCVTLMNPLSGELSVLRQTLLYGGLESIGHNVNRRATDLKFYEFGNVYHLDPSKESTAERPLAPYSEKAMLGLWMTGNNTPASWNTKAAEASVYDMKAAVENIFRRLGVSEGMLQQKQGSDEIFSAKLDISTRQGKLICTLGLVRRKVLKKFEIEQDVVYAAIDWKALYTLAAKTRHLHRDTAHSTRRPRPRAVGRQVGEVCRHRSRYPRCRTQTVARRAPVRRLRRQELARRQEIVCCLDAVAGQREDPQRQAD